MYTQDSFGDINRAIEAWWDKHAPKGFDRSAPAVRLHEPSFGPAEVAAFAAQMLTTNVTMGPQVTAFERLYCEKFGYPHGISNNSGSSANLLMLAALTNPMAREPLHPGDEIIVPALTWSTSLWPVTQRGLVPVFVDNDPATLNVDPARLEAAIGPRTRAVMAVPIYGNPCDMNAILDICKRRNLQLIEDSCESMGATYHGKPVGSFGRVASFSFYYSHHITTLEGGICVTPEFELAELMRIIRAHGWVRQVEDRERWQKLYPEIDPKFLFVNEGYNMRLTEPQAVMGLIQIPKLEGFIAARRANAAAYDRIFQPLGDLFGGQVTTPGATHSWFGYPLILTEKAPFSKAEICAYFNAAGIETRPIIAGNLARQPGTKLFPHRIGGPLDGADAVMDRGFSIGVHHALTPDAISYVGEVVERFLKEKSLR